MLCSSTVSRSASSWIRSKTMLGLARVGTYGRLQNGLSPGFVLEQNFAMSVGIKYKIKKLYICLGKGDFGFCVFAEREQIPC